MTWLERLAKVPLSAWKSAYDKEKHPVIVVDYAGLKIEWNDKGDMSITRQSDATRIYISRTEWIVLLKVAELNSWPSVPPNCYLSE